MNELKKLLKPSLIQNNFDSFQVNEELNRVIMAVGYPRGIKEGWLDKIISSEGNFDLSMHIQPMDLELTLTDLNNQLVKQEADIIASQEKGLVNPSLRIQQQDTLNILEKMQRGEEKLFQIAMYLNARAYKKDKLDLLAKKILSELNSIMIRPKTPFLRMLDGMKSIYPIQEDKLKENRTIPSDALSACFPFTTAFLDVDSEGIMFGLNKTNNIPIILDPYKFANYNGLILGTSGAGKSVKAKLFIIRNLLRGVKTMVIDPQGEYLELTKNYNGQIVEIGRHSDTIINPFDLMGQDPGEKMLSLIDLFKIMCGDLTEVQKNILDKVTQKIYEQKGIITNNPDTWNKEPPIMEDLYNELLREKKTASRQETMTYEALENRIRIYVKGSFSFLNKRTNLDLNNDLVCFNITQMPSQIKPVMMYLIMNYVHKTMQHDRERKALVIDEAWTLLMHAEHSRYIFELIKTARKFGLGIILITQEVQDLLNSKAGNTILANTSWKYLTRQEPATIEELSEKFHLNHEEQNFLLTAMPGEGLLFAMNDHIPLRVVPSPKEYDLITTNPDEIREREEKLKGMETKEEENTEAYKQEKKYYLMKDLNKDQIEFLKDNGFTEARLCGLENSSKWYMVKKPESSESVEHAFMVEVIADEIRKTATDVNTFSSLGPDITFSIPQKQDPDVYDWYAIEVETGKQLKTPGDLNRKTGKNNISRHFKQWWFVVTNKNHKKDYQKLHQTLTRTEITEKIKALLVNL